MVELVPNLLRQEMVDLQSKMQVMVEADLKVEKFL